MVEIWWNMVNCVVGRAMSDELLAHLISFFERVPGLPISLLTTLAESSMNPTSRAIAAVR